MITFVASGVARTIALLTARVFTPTLAPHGMLKFTSTPCASDASVRWTVVTAPLSSSHCRSTSCPKSPLCDGTTCKKQSRSVSWESWYAIVSPETSQTATRPVNTAGASGSYRKGSAARVTLRSPAPLVACNEASKWECGSAVAAASKSTNCSLPAPSASSTSSTLTFEPRACTCSTRERSPLSRSFVTATRSRTTELLE
mmetsp:Transcript_6431/g.15037  ORF Transcript_6431/g.15037 Transcript_6431/m.15037 type:complete len:200 (+) Transcript_6431:237-836(+)